MPPLRSRAIRASAARVVTTAPEFQRTRKPWQERCWHYFNEIGEIKYAALFYARMLSKVELYPAVRSSDGKSVLRVVQPQAVDVLERIQDGTGSRARLLAKYGVQRFVAGESYLAVTFLEEGGEEWEMLSSVELQSAPQGGWNRDRGDGNGWKHYDEAAEGALGAPGEMFAYRFWAPHPAKSWEADSPLRGVMERCDVLITLGRAIRARGRSRIAGNGILLIADELSTAEEPPDSSQGNATENVYDDPVMQEIYDGMMEPMLDDSSVGQVVPVMLRGPHELLKDAIQHFMLSDAAGYPEEAQIEQELRRIALGLDMPVESLLGVADMNHWGAWNVSREAWVSHGQPIVEELVADVTRAFFGPTFDALALPGVLVDNQGNIETVAVAPGDVFVWYDASAVVLNPDRAKDAKDAHDRLTLSDASLLTALGFDPTDAPDEEEWQRRATLKITKITDRTQQPAGDVTPAGGGEQPSDVQPGPPAQQAARLVGHVEMAIEKAIEHAGGRVRARLQGNPEAREKFQSTRNRQLCSAAGRDLVASLFGPGQEHVLVSGAADDVLGPRLNGNRAAILREVEALAAKHLYDESSDVRLSQRMMRLIAREAQRG